ncbi:MAG: molybdate ABC transporter permease subunit [Burkholderiales bacterium]|nr:molybdate ABC transporter permease subunit [Phycisphaerae bacterium]
MSDLVGWGLLSLRVAVLASIFGAAIAVPIAFVSARRRRWWISVMDAMLTVPLLLPPTVLGFALIVVLGRHGPIGWLVREVSGTTLLFTEAAAVIAATIVALPLIYLPAKSAFRAIDSELEDTARLWGASNWTLFWLISMPMARKGIIAGLVLGFARALGEFGATVMVLGIQGEQGKRTLPIAIWLDCSEGKYTDAWPAVLVLGLISVVVVSMYNRFMHL